MPTATGAPLAAPTQVTRPVPVRRLDEDTGTATTTPALLIGQNEDRTSLLIVNTGTDTLQIGGPDCDIGKHFDLPAGGGISYQYVGPRYVCAKTTTTTWSYAEESL